MVLKLSWSCSACFSCFCAPPHLIQMKGLLSVHLNQVCWNREPPWTCRAGGPPGTGLKKRRVWQIWSWSSDDCHCIDCRRIAVSWCCCHRRQRVKSYCVMPTWTLREHSNFQWKLKKKKKKVHVTEIKLTWRVMHNAIINCYRWLKRVVHSEFWRWHWISTENNP